jgi:stage IV sporulation protein FB
VFTSGFIEFGRVRGVPIRFHWSVLIGALFFSGFRFAPAFWLSFPLLVLIHELGHAFVVQRLGHRALGIEVTGFGGLCHWDPRFASRLDHALVAWGGVAAQFVLFLIATAYLFVSGGPRYAWEAQVLSVFTTTNLWLMALNLLPIPPLDGARAWTLFGELKALRQRGWRRKKVAKPVVAKSGEAHLQLAKLLEKVERDARNARR